MKKLLLISYYFPPCGGAGVQRWLRILKYLAKKDWQITVLTTRDGDYPIIDKSLEEKIPAEITVHRCKTPIFGKLYQKVTNDKQGLPYGTLNTRTNDNFWKKFLYWVRINIIIPDARVIWNRYAFKEAQALLKKQDFDLVLTSSPPHSTQLIGLKLKRKYNVKWVTDFRDPWADIYYLKLARQNILSYKINKFLERKVIRKADLNLIVSDHINAELPEGNKITFTNSYDPEDFPLESRQESAKFRIKYIGKLTEAQDVNLIIQALNNLPQLHNDIEVTFVGTYQENPFNTSYPILIKNFLPHQEAIAEMINSDLLILLINNYPQNKGMLTTKLFEYLGSNVPIFCLGPQDGDANKIIQECQGGVCIEYGNLPKLKSTLYNLFQEWTSSKILKKNSNKKYSIVYQIDKLDQILTKVISTD